jgi:hypothetical protein
MENSTIWGVWYFYLLSEDWIHSNGDSHMGTWLVDVHISKNILSNLILANMSILFYKPFDERQEGLERRLSDPIERII